MKIDSEKSINGKQNEEKRTLSNFTKILKCSINLHLIFVGLFQKRKFCTTSKTDCYLSRQKVSQRFSAILVFLLTSRQNVK